MSFSLRQFEDIQILADRIEQGNNFDADLEMFARFSADMRRWLLQHFDDPMIVERAQQIPPIEFEKSRPSVWDMLPGGGGISMFKSYKKKNELKEKVKEAARLFASIQFLLNNYFEDTV
jgi:hypothetical protein